MERGVKSGTCSTFNHADIFYVTCFSNKVSQGAIIPEAGGLEATDNAVCTGSRVVADSSTFSPFKLELQDSKSAHTVEANLDTDGRVRLTEVRTP